MPDLEGGLKGEGFGGEPGGFGGGQEGRQATAHHLVVGVDPVDLFGGHQRFVEESQVDGEERDGLELQEVAVLVAYPWLHHHQILRADSVAASL